MKDFQQAVKNSTKDGTTNASTSKRGSTLIGTPGISTKKSTKKSTKGKRRRPRSALPPIDLSTPGNTHTAVAGNGSKVVYPRNPKTGQTMPIPLSEIGKASRFGDKALEREKCTVFEVVLQSQEETMCPACARSPKRAQLPAHARGCFGLS